MAEEKIEILSVELLEQHRALVEDLKRFGRSLRLEFGWHYLLDITWIISHLGSPNGLNIMDAGAGVGMIQWYLAREGANVISADRISREALPMRYRTRFRVKGLRPNDLHTPLEVYNQRFSHGKGLSKLTSPIREAFDSFGNPASTGRVLIYNQNLDNLVDIPDETLDAIVAVSALEHNTQEGLAKVVSELMRTLKPDGVLLSTLTATRDRDWWHEESSAWCYTANTLRDIFNLPPETPSNYDEYDNLFDSLRDCAELRDNLASFYFKSQNNGMPWGVWDPKYQPVGVCKIKPAREPIQAHDQKSEVA